jgi:hypothetical protein
MTRTRRTTLPAVAATLALLLAACADDRTAAPVTTTAGPRVIQLAPGGGGGGGGGEMAAADEMSSRIAWLEFQLGAELPALDTEAVAWIVGEIGAVDPTRIAAVAAALGLSGDPVEQPEDMGGGWVVGPTDGSAPSLWVSTDALGSWWYSAPYLGGEVSCVAVEPVPAPDEPVIEPATTVTAPSGEGGAAPEQPIDPAATSDDQGTSEPGTVEECTVPDPPTNVPTAAQGEELARGLLTAFGLDPALFELETWADEWGANVTAYLDLDGIRSPLAWSFTFGGDGVVQYANGMFATPERADTYPRVGTAAGFARLSDGSYSWGGWYAFDTLRSSEPVAAEDGASADQPVEDTGPLVDPLPVEPGMPEPGDPIVVTITDVAEDYWMVWDVDGTVWLVPAYAFIGEDGGRYTVPAIPDEFLGLPDDGTVTEPPVEPPVTDTPNGTDVPGTDVTTPGETTPGETTIVPTTLPALPTDEVIGRFLGLTEDEAVDLAAAAGWEARIVARDGELLDVTDDLRDDRINLTITDGVVAAVSIG